jgi:hypothetical protein
MLFDPLTLALSRRERGQSIAACSLFRYFKLLAVHPVNIYFNYIKMRLSYG